MRVGHLGEGRRVRLQRDEAALCFMTRVGAVGFDRSTAYARETPRPHGRSKPRRWEPTWQPHELEADDVARPEPQGLKHPVGEEEVVFGGAEVEVAVFFVVLFNFIFVCVFDGGGFEVVVGRDIYALYIHTHIRSQKAILYYLQCSLGTGRFARHARSSSLCKF